MLLFVQGRFAVLPAWFPYIAKLLPQSRIFATMRLSEEGWNEDMTTMQTTLYAYWKTLAEVEPNKRLFGDAARWLTAEQTLSLSEHLAARFVSLGIGKGDYVALRAHRTLPVILALIALRAIGAVVVLTDPRQTPTEALCESLVPIPIKATVEQAEDMRYCVSTADGEERFHLLSLPPVHFTPENADVDAPAFLIFTSGSTGRKKAVVLSEGNLISNLLDSEPLGLYAPGDIALGALPIDHVFGLALLCGTAVLQYAMYLPEKTDIPSLLGAIEREHITRMNGVPSLYLAMCEQKDGFDLSSLKAGFIGGSGWTEQQFCAMEQSLDMTLVPVYGMSECIGIACANGHAPQAVRLWGVGPFYPMNEGVILDETEQPVPAGTEGEICVRGPMRMLGYYGQPMPKEAYLHTGDLGVVDENGVVHITGRKKEIIIRNGNNLSPVRIERALLSLTGVKAAAVVGLPDEKQGEVPAAVVIGSGTKETILADLASLLQKNELPVMIRFLEALPLTASGKPDRVRIREELNKWRNG